MEICQDHWHELKNAIRQRGMWKLVSASTVVRETQSPPDVQAESIFDPLAMIRRMISYQAGLAFGENLENDHHCPLCTVDQNLGTSNEWIDVNADILLQLCQARHLIAKTE